MNERGEHRDRVLLHFSLTYVYSTRARKVFTVYLAVDGEIRDTVNSILMVLS